MHFTQGPRRALYRAQDMDFTAIGTYMICFKDVNRLRKPALGAPLPRSWKWPAGTKKIRKKKKALNKYVIQFRQLKLEPQNERLVHNMSLEHVTGKAKSENSTSLSTLRCNFWMMSSRPFLDIFDFLPPGMQEESLEEVLTRVFCCWEPGQRATLTRWYCWWTSWDRSNMVKHCRKYKGTFRIFTCQILSTEFGSPDFCPSTAVSTITFMLAAPQAPKHLDEKGILDAKHCGTYGPQGGRFRRKWQRVAWNWSKLQILDWISSSKISFWVGQWSPLFGKDSHFDYFSTGLKPPTRYPIMLLFLRRFS